MQPAEQDSWPDFPKTGSGTDSRRMCFEQGKAFVYMPPDDDSRVITEWPNGVIEQHVLADDTISSPSISTSAIEGTVTMASA